MKYIIKSCVLAFNIVAIILIIIQAISCNNLSKSSSVYICTSYGQNRYFTYHTDKNCKALSNCQTDVLVIKYSDAKSQSRKPCGLCCSNLTIKEEPIRVDTTCTTTTSNN